MARIQNAPGDRWDWVAIYKHGANPAVAGYGPWTYTHSIIDGRVTLNSKTAQAGSVSRWPVRPGIYSLYLLKDDLYVKIAARPSGSSLRLLSTRHTKSEETFSRLR